MLEWRDELLNICSHVNADLQWSLNLPDSNCRNKTNKQSRKKKNHPTVETQTVKQQQHPVENSPLFVFSLSKWNLKYSDSTIFHRRFVLHWRSHQPEFPLGDFFGPCFQPVFRQWKEESERFSFYLSSMGWLCVVFLTLESFSIFMGYHSRPCGTGNLLLSPSYFYETTGKSQTRKQWLTLFGKVTRRTALRCVFIRHSHTVIHKHGRSPPPDV